jgi:CheY-like chemotaxis protein
VSLVGASACLLKPVRSGRLHDSIVTALSPAAPPPAPAPVRPAPLLSVPPARSGERRRPPGRRPRVLLVDDSAVNQKVSIAMLSQMGCRVAVVSSGREALEALSQTAYDLVLMDCQMPEMDGYQTTLEIRRREGAGRHTPVVALTANAMPGDRDRCLMAGMDDYIAKPVRPEVLQTVLSPWLNGWDFMREGNHV